MLNVKTLSVFIFLLRLVSCLLLLPSHLASAAQASVERPFIDAADLVVSALDDSGLVVKERADTDRFVILYVQGEAQQSVAITLFALPEQTDRITITVNSASPADEHLDNQLLQSIRSVLLEP